MHMDKEQFLQLLEAQQRSGLSIQNYCQQHNISFSKFSYWKKKFITSSGSNSSPKKLVPIKVQSEQWHSSGVSIHLPNGIDVEFSTSDDKVALQMLNTICTRYV